MSDLKPCQYPSDLPGQLRFWAKECDRTNHGCHVRALLAEAADELDRRTQPDQLPGPGKLMPDNAPLTMEELRGMDGERVWVQFRDLGMYALAAYHADPDGDDGDDVYLTNNLGGRSTAEEIWEQGGDIYRRKPEGGDR